MFYYDYSNLQVSKVQNRTIIVENAAEAELYGAELELTARLPKGFQVDGAASWLHSEYKDFHCRARAISTRSIPGATCRPCSTYPAIGSTRRRR